MVNPDIQIMFRQSKDLSRNNNNLRLSYKIWTPMPNWFECVGNLHSKITIYSEIGWHVGNTLQDIYVSSDCWKYVSIVYGKHATILQTKSISDLSRGTACWKQFRKRVSCNFGNSISDTFRTHLLDSRRSQVWSCPMDFQISTNSSWHWLYEDESMSSHWGTKGAPQMTNRCLPI